LMRIWQTATIKKLLRFCLLRKNREEGP